MMEALVYKSTGSWYIVKAANDKIYNARIKGAMKLDGLTSTNPVAVGDIVELEIENEDQQSAMITVINNRKNYIARQSPAHKMHHHIIASNLDQSLLVATLRDPKTSTGFIDRFLVSSEAYHVPALIVFNKSDLFRKKEEERFEEVKEMYERVGYRVFKMSVEKNEGVEELMEMMKNKITLISGHSGVGKSSFINIMLPNLKLKTKDVSGWSGKGMHTTTFAEMFDIADGGKIIDTPGMREFGIVDIEKKELAHYFPEMRALMQNCQFNNCIHIEEPGCAIKKALDEGVIHFDRYISYYKILESMNEKSY